ncbi:MAG: exonuclease domain-containing protein [Marinifilaceae bacterium]
MSQELLDCPADLFAVLAIETTGFSPKQGDTLLEIAIQTVNWRGEIVDFYETLVNPQQEFTGHLIHGITQEMTKQAPTLEEITPDLLCQINGKTLVGHNLPWLLKFLKSINLQNPTTNNNSGICTLYFSNLVDQELPFLQLEKLCEYYDIDIPETQSAKTSCIATAKLFSILKNAFIINRSREEFSSQFVTPIEIGELPPSHSKILKREEAQDKIRVKKERLFELLNRLSSQPSESIPVQQYLMVLDRALADRILTEKEAYSLFELAKECSISKEQAMEIHEEYIRKLVRVYLLDEILTPSEMDDLNTVAELLGVDQTHLTHLIDYEQASIAITCPEQPVPKESLVGKSVCFAGHLHSKINGQKIKRGLAQQLANERGLIVKSVVSKKLDFLVVTDPDVYSAKGKKGQKAREYDVSILSEEAFWQMIGVKVE